MNNETTKKSRKDKRENEIATYSKLDEQLLHFIKGTFNYFYRDKTPPEGWHYRGQYDFLLQHASFYKSSELTAEEREIVNMALIKMRFKPKMKECFYNSQALAVCDPSGTIKYCEGLATSLIPILHGWCEINKKVVDITWRDGEGHNYFGEFAGSYFGFPINTNEVINKQLRTKLSTPFLDDWSDDWKIFKKPFASK